MERRLAAILAVDVVGYCIEHPIPRLAKSVRFSPLEMWNLKSAGSRACVWLERRNEPNARYGSEADLRHPLKHWRLALSDAVATTPAGLACQVSFAFGVFGSLERGGNIDNPADFEFGNIWADDHEGRLLRSILAGAENMEGAA